MPESGQNAGDEGGPNLEQHPLVEALVPDPSQGPPNATVLRGFLGKSTREGAWRLYLTAALDEYVEINEADILHSRPLSDDEGTLVWVPKGLQLQHIRTQSQQVQADMLSGSLTSTHLASTVGSREGFPGAAPPPQAFIQSDLILCPPQSGGRGRCFRSDVVACPSTLNACFQVSVDIPCFSVNVLCGSNVCGDPGGDPRVRGF